MDALSIEAWQHAGMSMSLVSAGPASKAACLLHGATSGHRQALRCAGNLSNIICSRLQAVRALLIV